MSAFDLIARVPGIWAHRGASATRPENTIEAFTEAREQGADGVELDVRRSADGALVVHHDAALPDGRLVMDLQVGELPPHVALLGDALDACSGMVVNVEIKNNPGDPDHDPDEVLTDQVVALLQERPDKDRMLVSSFSLATIDRVAELDPDLRRGYLTSGHWDQLAAIDRAATAGHHAFHPFQLAVNAEIVEAAHEAGLAVVTWTVDDPDRMRWLVDQGVDVLITNRPDVAVAAFAPV